MADENAEQIRQEMILKADQVFLTLNRLNAEFTKFGDVATKAIDGTRRGFDKLGKLNAPSIDTRCSTRSIPLRRARNEPPMHRSSRPTKSGRRSYERRSGGRAATQQLAQKTINWLLSMETLGRVIQTQLLVRSLNTARDVVKDSYDDYLKFPSKPARFVRLTQS